MKVFNNKSKKAMWVSNNRVLVGGSKKVSGRNPNFDTDETRLLISLWGDPKIQKTLITTHKKHAVIARLADKMRDYGYQRSAEEINTRIKNLKCFYNRIKKDNEGTDFEPTWKHYAAMDEIMTRAIFSVRPNEIPKPSLKYKLEEAKREREERGEIFDEIEEAELMRTLQANQSKDEEEFFNGTKNKDNKDKHDSEMEDDDNEDNENSHDNDQNPFDDDMDYEPSFNNNNSNPISNNNNDDRLNISLRLTRSRKNENIKNKDEDQNEIRNISQNSIDIEEPSIIKDEPIDVDDDSNDEKLCEEDKESDSFPLAEYLKPSSSNKHSSNSNKIITTVAAQLKASTTSTTSTSSPLKIGQATTIISMSNSNAVSNNVTTNTQAKISLVPTNFLLKPQNQNLQEIQSQKQIQQSQGSQTIKTSTLQGLQINRQIPIRPKPSQPRIIYTHQTPNNQPTNGIVNTSNGPMKVLLVNALQNNSQNVQNLVTPTATILQNKSVEIQNNSLYQPPTATLQSNLSNINKNNSQTASVNLNGLVSSTSGDKLGLLGAASSNGKTAIGYRALLGQLVRTQEESNQINRERLQLERERFEYEKSMGERFFKFLPDVVPNLLSLIQPQHQLPQQRLTSDPNMTQSIFVTAPIVSAVEIPSGASNEQINKISNNQDDAPFVLLTPKKEKEDD